jgi:hypothetical protein
MTDKIVSMQSNSDGSYDFGFLFDNGAGITGETNVHVPAPTGTPAVYASDGVTVVTPAVPAVPYTPQTASAAALPIAGAQKANWLASVNSAAIIGAVTLPG